jgi:hypothetical protein
VVIEEFLEEVGLASWGEAKDAVGFLFKEEFGLFKGAAEGCADLLVLTQGL